MNLHEYFYVYQIVFFILLIIPMYICILSHVSVAVQVWPQATFRRHPFLVADLLPWPDIGDLYGYIIA